MQDIVLEVLLIIGFSNFSFWLGFELAKRKYNKYKVVNNE